jgi:hypothetical protein
MGWRFLLGLFLAEAYIALLAFAALVAADLLVAAAAPWYLEARAEAVALLEEVRRGRERRRGPSPRLVVRLEEVQARLRRAVLMRFVVLTAVYVAFAVAAVTRAWLVPLSCCVPGLSVPAKNGLCVSTSAMVAAAALLAALPLVQEEAVFIAYRVLAARGRNKL